MVWSLSGLYKPTNVSKNLVGGECWYAIIVCIMYDISLVYHIFQTTVKTANQ